MIAFQLGQECMCPGCGVVLDADVDRLWIRHSTGPNLITGVYCSEPCGRGHRLNPFGKPKRHPKRR